MGTTGVVGSLKAGTTGAVDDELVGRRPNSPRFLSPAGDAEAEPLSVGLSNGLPVLVASGLLGPPGVLTTSPGAGASGVMGAGASGYDSTNSRNGSQAYKACRTELQ